MAKILICYWFENLPLAKRSLFKRKLFGDVVKTHKGRYTSYIKGYLSKKKYEKPIRSVIIFEEKYLSGVISILSEFKAKYKTFRIQNII